MNKIDNDKKEHLNITAIREHLQTTQGRQYWRSLEELADTEAFQKFLHNEFPQMLPEWEMPVNRRNFLKLMGASLALAGLNACTRQPTEKIYPYVQPPEEVVPGKPLFFATATVHHGYANGVLVESHEGRPTKVEGNPQHPASLGATDVFGQASVLTLYDPDRSQVVIRAGRISTWDAFLAAIGSALEFEKPRNGRGLRVLTETVTSPTLSYQLQTLLEQFPAAKWHQYEPVGRDAVREGARLAFGQDVDTHYRIDRAEVILALEADFLCHHSGSLRYTREFVSRRQVRKGKPEMNRLYVVESTPSLTGAMADHKLTLRASEIENLAKAIAVELGIAGESEGRARLSPRSASHAQWIAALARDLKKNRGKCLVIAGEHQPPIVHALAHAMNHALGNAGATVLYTDPVAANPVNHIASLRELVSDMEAGAVDLLVILGGNPVFNTPADVNFAEKLSKVKLRVHFGLYQDETSELCHWHVPSTHYLESWSDARAFDGTASVIQPLIAPLYEGKSIHEMLAVLTGSSNRSDHDIVHDYWKSQRPSADFEKFWQIALNAGLIESSAFPPKSVELKRDEQVRRSMFDTSPPASAQELEIIFRPDPTVWDGSYTNNGWLQELPKPLTKLTWDNAALISPAMAERLALSNEEVVELHYNNRSVRAPIWILPGHPDYAVTVHFGYGRNRVGNVGAGTGFNAYALRTADAPWFGIGLEIRKTGERHLLASTQHHHSMENRHLVRAGTLEEYVKHPDFVHEMSEAPAPDETLYPGYKYEGYAWGMAVDLNACTGCSACVVACQAENNSPVVGKDQVSRGREMHWIRIDRYYEGDLDAPNTYNQPVLCMHCENAPCELVCPVAATLHNEEGLNEMIYNRCVGTRYCSNNCPYKVRRFNFYHYANWSAPTLKMLANPDVTVRFRGVMEKCSYCVQRINAAHIQAKLEDREIRDGEIVTACQQVCPADALVFGNINDPNSRVAKFKAGPLNYGILTDLNTKPRTTYLARLRNPNPEIEEHDAA